MLSFRTLGPRFRLTLKNAVLLFDILLLRIRLVPFDSFGFIRLVSSGPAFEPRAQVAIRFDLMTDAA